MAIPPPEDAISPEPEGSRVFFISLLSKCMHLQAPRVQPFDLLC